MDPIMRRLFENKQMIDTNLLNAKDHSDEAYDLMDILEMRIRDARDKLFDDVDMDDSGMNSYGKPEGERTIVYQANLYHFEFDGKSEPKESPLSSKEWRSLESELSKNITLPKEDEEYEYSVNLSYEGTTLKISLKREEKLSW